MRRPRPITIAAAISAVLAAVVARPATAVKLGDITDARLSEVSGIAASARNAGLYWVHNDSGDGPFVYAIDGTGRKRATYRVDGASALDWEDIAVAGGSLFVGDIGDNFRFRPNITVYRVREPSIPRSVEPSRVRATSPAVALRLVYPDGPRDAEALAIDPVTGDLYLITKALDGPAGVYRFPDALRAAKGGELQALPPLPAPVGSPITAGDISPLGDTLVVRDLSSAYVLHAPRPASEPFAAVLSAPARTIELPAVRQGEAVGFRRDGKAIVTTTEGLPARVDQISL